MPRLLVCATVISVGYYSTIAKLKRDGADLRIEIRNSLCKLKIIKCNIFPRAQSHTVDKLLNLSVIRKFPTDNKTVSY